MPSNRLSHLVFVLAQIAARCIAQQPGQELRPTSANIRNGMCRDVTRRFGVNGARALQAQAQHDEDCCHSLTLVRENGIASGVSELESVASQVGGTGSTSAKGIAHPAG